MIRAGSSTTAEPLRFRAMERSLRFVLLGTFTLRFSTGLTGAMLGLYLADLPTHGGPAVDARVVGLFAAIFYLTELVLSPIFGILSDRIGHHRVMLYGPVFGGDRGGPDRPDDAACRSSASTRLLEGASTAASVPSILGFIALATAGNELLRGKAAARFEGATLAGLGFGFIVAPKLFEAIGATAFFLNAVVYGVSFLIYWRGVKDPAGEVEAVASPHVGFAPLRRARPARRTSSLLAPTWIAVNASIGLWFSQSLFQFSQANPNFPDQVLMRGFDANQITRRRDRHRGRLRRGPAVLGQPLQVDAPDDDHRATGIVGGAVLVGAGLVVNHSAGLPIVDPHRGHRRRRRPACSCWPGRRPAALGLLADISERFPADRGAIMGLYSVFLAIGQIIGSLIGGFAADWRGIDGMLLATAALLGDRAHPALAPAAPRSTRSTAARGRRPAQPRQRRRA